MPSGHHSSGHHGGHFSGGHSRSSHSGGHFSGSRSSGTRTGMSTLRWRPHTTVIFGRSVYLGAGRARTVSVLGILLVLALFAAFGLGMAWMDAGERLGVVKDDYAFYHNMAETAKYTTTGKVTRIELYDYESGKYCIFYTFANPNTGITVEGWSMYVYDADTVPTVGDSIELVISCAEEDISKATDSVPLDYKNTVLTDDAEYNYFNGMVNGFRAGTLIAGGAAVLMVVGSLAITMSAKKATPEQLAANNQSNTTTTTNAGSGADTGTWRCGYCSTLNDSSKTRCDGCGAKRQK